MLPAKHRLKSERNFKRLLKRGRSFFSPHISVRVVPNHESETRFAFVVSTKVSKKTVIRNKLKRRLREIVRGMLPDIRRGYDILIAGKQAAIPLSFDELQKSVHAILLKARMYEKK